MMNIIPKNIINHNQEGFNKFKQNTHRLITPLDLFWTDIGLIGGKKDASDNGVEFGWLVNQVRQERETLKSGQSQFKNIGTDLFKLSKYL